MDLERCRVLVTGGNGYVGQYVIPELMAQGAQVTSFDSIPGDGSYPSGMTYRCGDVRDFEQVRQAVAGHDVIVHLACRPVGASMAQPVEDFEVNALGTVHVLKAAQDHGVRRVVYMSTSEVYGRPQYQPIDEAHPTEPVTPYGASKPWGEIYCRTFERVYGLKSVVLRCFNIFGAAADEQPRSTVDAVFARRVLAGQPPMIRGNPGHARDFVHVKDAARAVRLAIQSGTAPGHTINIGSGAATTLEQLASLVIETAGTDLEPEVESPLETPTVFQADISRARQLLRFEPSVSLADELRIALRDAIHLNAPSG